LWAWVPLSLALCCGDAHSGADEPSREPWKVEEARVRFNYFDQEGFGYQSQAGPGPAGSERLHVYEPMFYLRVRQNNKVEHTATVAIDVITSASTDAIDVTTSASRFNPYSHRPGGINPPDSQWNFRGSFGGSVEVSQILNPSTWVKAGYGITWQKGELFTPWNSVPFLCTADVTACSGRVREKFPPCLLAELKTPW
jgi:hypothetical protein